MLFVHLRRLELRQDRRDDRRQFAHILLTQQIVVMAVHIGVKERAGDA
jgi:hypothetical protein